MNKGNFSSAGLVSCIKERRMPWRLRIAFEHIMQKPHFIPIRHFLKKFSSKKDTLLIEISNCNLKCAMCARSSALGLKNTRKGMMEFELFKKIIDKVVDEKIKFRELMFGNWGEPLLNPFFPEMVRYAKSKLSDTKISTFTNLTSLEDPAAIIGSGLDAMRISISGMTQDVYSKNHIGGNINLVLSNLMKLSHVKKQLSSDIKLILRFHDYLYNKNDAALARNFCEDNGIEFELLWCYICCVEADVKFHNNKEELGKFYGKFIDMEKEQRLMRTSDDYRNCKMLKEFVVIDFDGRLYRCCGVYEEKHLLGSFFDYKIRDIHGIKSEICQLCAGTPISWRYP